MLHYFKARRIKKTMLMPAAFFFLSIALPSAQQKKGSDIIIKTTDSREIIGELIAVKAKSLLVLKKKSLGDISIETQVIDYVKVIRHANILSGGGIGMISGLTAGFMAGLFHFGDAEPGSVYTTAGAVIGASVGLVCGLAVSGLKAKDKNYHFQGISETELAANLKSLNKYARIKDAN